MGQNMHVLGGGETPEGNGRVTRDKESKRKGGASVHGRRDAARAPEFCLSREAAAPAPAVVRREGRFPTI